MQIVSLELTEKAKTGKEGNQKQAMKGKLKQQNSEIKRKESMLEMS